MRLSKLPLVTGIIFLLASVGLMVAAKKKADSEPDPVHPITSAMLADASREKSLAAPALHRDDTQGDPIDLAKLSANGPVFVIFIMEGCPCSIEAQPFFERLHVAFGDKVSFLAITDGTTEQGREWKAHFQMAFPLISNPSKDLMYAFGAKHSAYSALIGRGGHIIQLWPGYDKAMLNDMAIQLGDAAGMSGATVDTSDAPRKPTSGCVF